MASVRFAHEKYTAAVVGLATGAWPLRERVVDNYASQAYHAYPLEDEGVELSALQDRIRLLHRRMTEHGTVADSVAALTDQDVHDAAVEILSIAVELDRMCVSRGG
jgi:hypothetical protein